MNATYREERELLPISFEFRIDLRSPLKNEKDPDGDETSLGSFPWL